MAARDCLLASLGPPNIISNDSARSTEIVQALIFMLLRGWHHDTENAALPKLALQFDPSTLLFDGALGDGQAKAVTAFGAGAGFVQAIESLEKLHVMFGGDARPLVGNFNGSVTVATANANRDPRLRRCVAHGVMDDVHQCLSEQE